MIRLNVCRSSRGLAFVLFQFRFNPAELAEQLRRHRQKLLGARGGGDPKQPLQLTHVVRVTTTSEQVEQRRINPWNSAIEKTGHGRRSNSKKPDRVSAAGLRLFRFLGVSTDRRLALAPAAGEHRLP